MIRVITEPQKPRLRVRRVEPGFDHLVTQARGTWLFHVEHGGEVANAYRWPAETEVVVVIIAPNGRGAAWFGRARANNVTQRSAAAGCLVSEGWHDGAVDYWDLRIGESRRMAAREALKCLWRRAWNEPTSCLFCAATS